MKDNNEYPETAEQAADNWVKSLDTYMPDYPTTDHIAYPSFIQGANWMKCHPQRANNDYAVKVIEAEIARLIASKSVLTFQGKMNTQLIIDNLNGILKQLLTPNN